ncbi:MAG TPA: response regulator [Deltaproteobacteria bacterium]|nr:MAG: response regulator [Deltaproteobacteria bacterium]HEC31140.1 response regulator [Deltaproteobacteria bacterium]
MEKMAGTILYVDDEPSLREIGKTMLCCLGFNTIVAASGEECLEVIQEKKNDIDLIILDLVMPGLNGQQTLEELHKREINVPVILTTGFALSDLPKNPAELQHAEAVITKPFDLEKLRAVIQNVLGNKLREVRCE